MKTSSRWPGRRSVVAAAVAAAAMAAGLGLAQKQITLNFSVLITCEPRSFSNKQKKLVNQGDRGVQHFFSSLHRKKDFS